MKNHNSQKGILGLVILLSILMSLIPGNATSVEDTTPPELVEVDGFDFTPKTIDVSSAPGTVTFTLHITDDLSGVWHVHVTLVDHLGRNWGIDGLFKSGDSLDGYYEGSLTVPQFLEAGTWHITSIHLGDSAHNGRSYFEDDLIALGFPTELEVVSYLEVDIDIKPGSCPNPLNMKSKGVLPLAVLGTEDFDVFTIDPSSVRLSREGVDEEVTPIRSGYEDVAKPFDGELCGCHDLNGDGWVDLTLKVKTQELVQKLALADVAGETIPLMITGYLMEEYNRTPIEGQDCVWILEKGKGKGQKKGK